MSDKTCRYCGVTIFERFFKRTKRMGWQRTSHGAYANMPLVICERSPVGLHEPVEVQQHVG